MRNLREVREELANKGGFSYSLHYGDLAGSQQYSVAYSKHTEKVFDQLPTDAEVADYVNSNITLLEKEDLFFGGWEHEGRYYLDVAQHLSKREYSREAAIQVGRDREQLAIFDLEYLEEITCELETITFEVFVRKCDVTGVGMNKGWLFNDEYYVANESDALEYCIKNGYSSIEEAYEDDFGYYTEWTVEDAWDETYDKDGNTLAY